MLNNIRRSLEDLLGLKYCDAISSTAKLLHNLTEDEISKLTIDKVEFYSSDFSKQQDELINKVGKTMVKTFENDNQGAGTHAFSKATKRYSSPIGGVGAFRVGEDGKLYLAAKSEHYHTPIGHNFHGYKLIDRARKLGIPNATHNNTRGFITRKLEREIIRTLNSINKDETEALEEILESKQERVLNRIINLETGSLAVEAGIKMMLARFYRLDKSYPAPLYNDRTPVFFVIADNDGGYEANYHGTTIIAQTFRGMWPDFYKAEQDNDIYKIVSIKKNDIADFREKIEQYNKGRYKTAGFLHEIILMNYGAIKIKKKFLQEAYKLCLEYDTPTLVDEIQSCMWYEGLYLFRTYNLEPDFVILGKGFSGGEYSASKVVTTYEMDTLNQFGALVTNGQEELASLACLITMEFALANGDHIKDMGDYFQEKLLSLKDKHDDLIQKIEGEGHLAAMHFKSIKDTTTFTTKLNGMCIDISAQTYKANCPPAALVKPPFILSRKAIDYLISNMDEVLTMIEMI